MKRRGAVRESAVLLAAVRLCLAAAFHEQENPANEAYSADDRSDRDGMLFVLIDLQGPDLGHVLFGRKRRIPAVGQGDNSNNDEDNAEQTSRFHKSVIVDLTTDGGLGSD